MNRFFSWHYPAVLGAFALGWVGHHGWALTRAACVSAREAAAIAVDYDSERALAHGDPFVERIAETEIMPERESRVRDFSRKATEAQAEAGLFLRLPYPKCAAPEFSDEIALHGKAQEQIRSLANSGETAGLRRGWQADTTIYCRSLLELARLERVREVAAEACKKRYAKDCRKTKATRGLDEEIAQLTVVRGINEKKLRDKWGARLATLVHCDLGLDAGAVQ